jgi:uncharacterized membrane protein
MYADNPPTTISAGRYSLYSIFKPFPIVCFTGTLVTDIAYWRTANVIWETFSVWLLAAGLVMAGFGVIAAAIDVLRHRAIHTSWLLTIGNAIVLGLSLINVFIHSRDGYTAVVPTGLSLSALVVIIMLFMGWTSRDIVYRQRIGVAN